MEITPSAVYQQAADQQRILVTGAARSRVTDLIISILNSCSRKYHLYSADQSIAKAEAPIAIINSAISSQSIDYRHHVLLLTSSAEEELNEITKLVNATPKSGMIIFPEEDQKLKTIIGKERADVQLLSYKILGHEIKDGRTFIINRTNDKFPVPLNGKQELLALAAAKELVRKIGISSAQFYKAAVGLQ
jgi:UDP-N-acetylmuramate: L-alanyl-gamma-D-glutamyl-meso-diaminopimelate ligase